MSSERLVAVKAVFDLQKHDQIYLQDGAVQIGNTISDNKPISIAAEDAYLLKNSVDQVETNLRGPLRFKTLAALAKLKELDVESLQIYGFSVIDYAYIMYSSGKSLNELSNSMGISGQFIAKVFDALSLPRLSREESIKRSNSQVPIEVKRERMRIARETQSADDLRENLKKATQGMTPEELTARSSAGGKAAIQHMTADELDARMKKMIDAVTTEGRSIGMKRRWGRLTSDERKAKVAAHTNIDELRRRMRYARSFVNEERRLKALREKQSRLSVRQIQAIVERLVGSRTTEQRSQTMRAMWEGIPDDQRGTWARQNYALTLGALSIEVKRANGLKGRLSTDLKPNSSERRVIAVLDELGIYVVNKSDAQPGQVYFGDSRANKTAIELTNGKVVIPDFVVSGTNKVLELYGDYWHSQEYVEEKGLGEYRWNETLMIDMYAQVGIDCKIVRVKQLKDPILREDLKLELTEWIKE